MRRRNVILGLLGSLLAAPYAGIGQVTRKLEFEVASVKPSLATGPGTSMRGLPGGRYSVTNATLKMIMIAAFGVRDYQILGGPKWMESDRWDIEAKAAADTVPATAGPRDPSVPDRGLLMVRSLLEDRFRLKIHREVKDAPIYELVIAKSGLKLKSSVDQAPVVNTPDIPPDGGTPHGLMRLNPRGNLEGNAVPLSQLAPVLSDLSGRLVVDKTGLAGLYDFKLEWAPDLGPTAPGVSEPAPSADPRASLFTAIQEQLGLKLEPARGPVEFIVVDSVDRPSDN